MNADRLLLDTVFVQALLNRRDQYYDQARALLPRVQAAAEVWVTEAVLLEIGNALSALNRLAAVQFIEQCYRTSNVHVVNVDTSLLLRGVALYHARPDKTWSLTDCISMVVMQEQGLSDAVTMDVHFAQAGYRALMREET
ncbi:MAG: type II toxin-antitoxin system VapC family toxin [Anaerolineae bacterium]|nr:type II toxin-antitoxin system VapC family toxin [Anaerolineae bacterium]